MAENNASHSNNTCEHMLDCLLNASSDSKLTYRIKLVKPQANIQMDTPTHEEDLVVSNIVAGPEKLAALTPGKTLI